MAFCRVEPNYCKTALEYSELGLSDLRFWLWRFEEKSDCGPTSVVCPSFLGSVFGLLAP